MDIIAAFKQFLTEYKAPHFRGKSGAFYSSEITKNARDIYWKLIGEPETNPTDLVGRMRMNCGNWIETGVNSEIIANLHWFNVHVYGNGQVQVGHTEPVAVNGKLDNLLVQRNGDTFGKPIVLEIKSKYGGGADWFLTKKDPGESYLGQIGDYLRELDRRDVTNEGIFLFIIISDSNLGEVVAIDAKYDRSTDLVTAYRARTLLAETDEKINFTLKVGFWLDRLARIQKMAEKKELPEVEHYYKYALTKERLLAFSDTQIRAAINGEKVLGDWQISYSKYKQKHIELEGTSLGYTDAEKSLLLAEYKRRHPKSKIGMTKLEKVQSLATGTDDE